MKHFYLLLFLVFVSCTENQQNDNEKASKEESSVQEEEENQPEEEIKWDYYAGTVGLYGEEVVMQISVNKSDISGGYWYVKHGKKLTLSGQTVAKFDEWKFEESYNGKATGRFSVTNYGDSLIGQWFAPGKDEGQEVNLKRIISDSEEIELSFDTYTYSHVVPIFFGEEEDEEIEVVDEFKSSRIGDYLLFSYEVTGTNAHTGHISGLAEMVNDNKAIFKGEMECELTIEFTDYKTVNVDETDCHYYRGMRAYFSGELKKVR